MVVCRFFGIAFRHTVCAAIDGGVCHHVGFVVSEPEHASDGVGEPASHLCYKGAGTLLCGNGTLVEVGLAFVFVGEGTGEIGACIDAAVHLAGEVERCPLVVVLVGSDDVAEVEQAVRLEVEGHHLRLSDVLAVDEVEIAVHAVDEAVEEAPYAGIAEALAAEVGRAVGIAEGEFAVLAVEVSLFACELHHVLGIHHVFLVLHVEGVDAALVGVCGNAVVGNAYGNPYRPLLFVAFANHFENPDFVGVGHAEAFSASAVSVFVDEVGHYADSLACGLGTLQSEGHERGVVDAAFRVLCRQFGPSAEGGFHDGKLELVHQSHYGVGFGCFGDVAEVVVGVTVDDAAHFAGSVLSGRVVDELAVHAVAVHVVRDEGGSGFRCLLAYQEIGAGRSADGCQCEEAE